MKVATRIETERLLRGKVRFTSTHASSRSSKSGDEDKVSSSLTI